MLNSKAEIVLGRAKIPLAALDIKEANLDSTRSRSSSDRGPVGTVATSSAVSVDSPRSSGGMAESASSGPAADRPLARVATSAAARNRHSTDGSPVADTSQPSLRPVGSLPATIGAPTVPDAVTAGSDATEPGKTDTVDLQAVGPHGERWVRLQRRKYVRLPPRWRLRSADIGFVQVAMVSPVRGLDVENADLSSAGESGNSLGDDAEEDAGADVRGPVVADEPVAAAPKEWSVLDEEYGCSLAQIRRLLWHYPSPFIDAYYRARGYSEIAVQPWSDTHVREVRYRIPKSGLVKSMVAVETQKVEVDRAAGFVVSVSVSMPDAPMGSCFQVELQFVHTAVTASRVRLQVSGEVVFLRSVGLLKWTISNGTRSGLTQSFQLFADLLRRSIEQPGEASAQPASLEPAPATSPGPVALPSAQSEAAVLEPARKAAGHISFSLSVAVMTVLIVLALLLNLWLHRLSGHVAELRLLLPPLQLPPLDDGSAGVAPAPAAAADGVYDAV